MFNYRGSVYRPKLIAQPIRHYRTRRPLTSSLRHSTRLRPCAPCSAPLTSTPMPGYVQPMREGVVGSVPAESTQTLLLGARSPLTSFAHASSRAWPVQNWRYHAWRMCVTRAVALYSNACPHTIICPRPHPFLQNAVRGDVQDGYGPEGPRARVGGERVLGAGPPL